MDNKFEGKFSISSTYSNKTNNTNESNALIKEKNINECIHNNNNNKVDLKSANHCKQSKHIADYFEESLNIFNAIRFYLEKSQKNNSISMRDNILKIKSCNNNNIYNSNKLKHLLSLQEKQIIMNDIEKRSLERKKNYNALFNNINESIINIKNTINNNSDIISYKQLNTKDVYNLSSIHKVSSSKDEDTTIYCGVGYNENNNDDNDFCNLSDSAMEEHIDKTIINNNDLNTINESESGSIINNNDDYSINENTISSISNRFLNDDNIRKHQLITKSFSKYALTSNINTNITLTLKQPSQIITQNNNDKNNCCIF